MSESHRLAHPRHLADGRVCCSHSDALCDACTAHHAAQTVPDPYAAVRAATFGTTTPTDAIPPDPYAAGLAKLRETR